MRGFAFEGAAMGFALLDRISLVGPGRIGRFLSGAGGAHAYMVHVGIGWLWARLRVGIEHQQRRLDPLLGWLAFDGWGFHEGFFHWSKYIGGQLAPRQLKGYARRVFDQGLGRSFWFVNGGNVELISESIGVFGGERQDDLWSGIGLAASYAGGAKEHELEILRDLGGSHRSALAQGAAFAAKARERAGNLTDYTEMATGALCGCSALEAAKICDVTLENLPIGKEDPLSATIASKGGEGEKQPAYEIWRQRIQSHFQNVSLQQETFV
jgi:hypothetical protein